MEQSESEKMIELATILTQDATRTVMSEYPNFHPDFVDPLEFAHEAQKLVHDNFNRLEEVYRKQEEDSNNPTWLEEVYGLADELAHGWLEDFINEPGNNWKNSPYRRVK